VIAFGTPITDPEAYSRYARPGIERVAEPDSEVYAFAAVGSISRGFNLVLDAAAGREDLEALVLVHQDVEIADPEICPTVRAVLSDPGVAAIGPVGAVGATSIAWWEGEISAAPVTHRYQEHGGGEMPAYSFKPHASVPAEVDTLDGSLLVLSPWAVRDVRFDEGLALGHGYDLDFCRQLTAAGKRLLTAGIRTVHHRPLELIAKDDLWIEAHMQFAAKWDDASSEWKDRARRAEAEREAARTIAYSTASKMDARALPLERELDELESTLSWRLTRPLRELNLRRRRRAQRQPSSLTPL
jgi:hypothetical protein